MIHTSTKYRRAVQGNRQFGIADRITFRDGTTLGLDIEDFVSYSIDEATSSPGKFEVGAAVIKEYSAVLNNEDGKFDRYDFEGADIVAQVGLMLEDGTWEYLQKGYYRVVEAKAQDLVILVKAYDSMLFFDSPYSGSMLSYPASLLQIVQDACNACSVAYDAGSIEMGGYTVRKRPDSETLTYRDIISYCAQIMGCYAKVNHMDRLEFGWYDLESLPDGIDGGDFTGTARPYETGDTLSGGNFTDYSSGDSHDCGTFRDAAGYHHFYHLGSQTINTDDITITGVLVSVEKQEEGAESCLYGTEGYVLEISENPLIQEGAVQQVARHVGQKLAGSIFRPLSIIVQSDPCIEAGDAALVTDRRQRTYRTVITNTTFTMGGMQKVECSAETPTEKNYTKYGAVTKILAKARDEVDIKLSAYDIAVQQMNQLAANTMGFYSTTVAQKDGSILAYRHDKPKLAESKVVYKSGIDGFFVTRDYTGEDSTTLWKAGFDSSGNAVLNILSVIGINFTWARGGELILGGDDGKGGVMLVKDAAGNVVVQCDINGITATKGTFSGRLEAATGTFKGNLEAAGGTFSGELEAASGTFKGALQAATGTFGGMTAEGNTLVQESVAQYPHSGVYKIIISGEGVSFDDSEVKYNYYKDDMVQFEPSYSTKIELDSIETNDLRAENLKLVGIGEDDTVTWLLGINKEGEVVKIPRNGSSGGNGNGGGDDGGELEVS